VSDVDPAISVTQLLQDSLPGAMGQCTWKVKSGYPPTSITCDRSIRDSGIRSGDTLVLEPDQDAESRFIVHEIPADNSCLFNAIAWALDQKSPVSPERLRESIIDAVLSNPVEFNDAVLGKSIEAYCSWILDPSSWGGDIELAILTTKFGIVISVIDIKTLNFYRFGESCGYKEEIFLCMWIQCISY
jgi:ubiquitin thioesterase OTU1